MSSQGRSEGGRVFPDLPVPADLVVDEPFWRFQPPQFLPGGVAHLRVWTTRAGGDERLAVVTELGLGPSITNSIEHIWRVLADEYPAGRLVLLEHWPASESLGEEYLDQVLVGEGEPQWRRVWPTPSNNLKHQAFNVWMTTFGSAAGISDNQG